MPEMIEQRGPLITRFIWWKLRHETGRWVTLSAVGKSGFFVHGFWEKEPEPRSKERQ